jgi:zinc D-Ala-D-Ala dipeptidase
MNSPRAALEAAQHHPDYDDVSSLPNVTVDLRYGTKHNLLHKDVYGGFQRALLHREAAAKFRIASRLLGERHPDFRFVVYDALRPQAAQIEFYQLVRGTPREHYFADPSKGSIHSFGFAIDLGLLANGRGEVDMGTHFDELDELSEPQKENEMLVSGRLRQEQLDNRLLLRRVMQEAGFLQLPHEWWHYDALPPAEVRARYKRLD